MNNISVLREMQARLVYSFLKPVVRAAARFSIPIRTLVDLLRLAYFEHLSRDGRSLAEIARVFDQTPRHMRSLQQRLEGDFFAAERTVGLARELEAIVALDSPRLGELRAKLSAWSAAEVDQTLDSLLAEGRIERGPGGRLLTTQQYVVMRSDQFHHRIDSINHLLDGTYRAVLHRLVFDDKRTAMTKTLTFSALADELEAFVKRLEAQLRVELAGIDENATFQGQGEQRYTLGLTLAPVAEPKAPPKRTS